MTNCSICGERLLDRYPIVLSIDVDNCFMCAHCATRLRTIRKHASSADPQFEDDINRLVSDIDSYPNIEDPILTYLSTFIRCAKRAYKDACKMQESNPVSNRLTESTHADRQPHSAQRNKSFKKRIFKSAMICLGVVISIIAIVLISKNSGLLGITKMWTCDTCGKTWRGAAYYGLNGDEVLCDECAKSYWSPLPYKTYQIDSNQLIDASTPPADYSQPTEAQLQQLREEAKAEDVSEVFWTRSDKSYHFDRNCPLIAGKAAAADGGTLYAGSLDDAFAANHWAPCDVCAGGTKAKLD